MDTRPGSEVINQDRRWLLTTAAIGIAAAARCTSSRVREEHSVSGLCAPKRRALERGLVNAQP